MPGPSKKQLQEWYKKFSEILLNEAAIDVNSPEDLGRVKNIQITKWDTTNPDKPDIKVSYAYAPHNGKDLVEPFSDTAIKREHAAWMDRNLKPAVTEEQIRQLYNMSREGTLMITSPTAGLKDIQMVRTDSYGKIITSRPISAYRNGGNEKLPEEDQIPQLSAKPASSLKPEDYNIPSRPAEPPAPANMHPGFWSWVGHMLGMDTDYSKLKRYELAMEEYRENVTAWERDLDEKESYTITDPETQETIEVSYDQYRLARMEHEQFAQELAVFGSDHLGKFSAIANSANELADKQFWKNEQDSVETSHYSTPRGKALKELTEANRKLSHEARTDALIHSWLSYDADPKKAAMLFDFTTQDFTFKQLDMPKCPGFEQMTPEKQLEYTNNMTTLFDFAALGAIGHPDILGKEPRLGCNAAETAQLYFGSLFNDMFTHCRSNPTEYFKYVDPAREKALVAMEAYSKGDKSQLGELLGCGMRQILRTAAALSDFTDHTLNTPYVIGKLYNTLQSDPDLLQASGLKEEEMQEAEAHMELYKIMRQGVQAKKDILDHAFENRTLNPEQLQKAAGDVLLFHHVILGLADGFKESEKIAQDGDEYKQLFEEYFGRDANMMSRGARTKDEARGTDRREFVHNRMHFLNANYPANKFLLGLLNKDGVKQYMENILEKTNLSKVGEMDRMELRELFSKKDSEIVSNLMLPSKPSSPKEKEDPNAQMQKETSNQQQKDANAPKAIG